MLFDLDKVMSFDLDDLLYRYDLMGFAVIHNALTDKHVEKLLAFWEKELTPHDKKLFDISFTWGREWAALIDPEPIISVLDVLFQKRFRLDHAFCVNEKFGNDEGHLHHGGSEFDKGLFHLAHTNFASGLVGVIYHLIDAVDDTPCFGCIPGSHKQYRSTPSQYMRITGNELLKRVPAKRGEAIIFNEALTHGTCIPTNRAKRRCIMLKYCYSYAAFRQPANTEPIMNLSPTPNYEHFAWEGKVETDTLTQRQQRIVLYPPYARDRGPVS